ncbi:MAG: ABC transporter permease [Candidatus Delongbacteria bacterium]|nr:ABC transporter permease [Candidatus Delongbacteria bacterium]
MDYIFGGISEAVRLIVSGDGEFWSIVWLSVKLSTISTLLASLLGVPAAFFLVLKRFRGRDMIITVSNSLMSIPTVVVGLLVYAVLSRRGPLGDLGLLFTQIAVVIGQTLLILPVVISLTVSTIRSLDKSVRETASSLGADKKQQLMIFFSEARFGVAACLITAFSRVFAEVGVSMMLGGNLRNYTRTITTAIALETSKGEFGLSIALGIVLLAVAFAINFTFLKFTKLYRTAE